MGVAFAALSEYQTIEFDLIGFLLTVIGIVLASIKGIVTYILMVGSLQLHPLDLLWRMTPLCVLQCLIYAYFFGEWDGLSQFIDTHPFFDSIITIKNSETGDIFKIPLKGFSDVYIKVFLNGCLAFALNWVSFTANKKTSALTMTVAANVKQAMSILLAVYVFSSPMTLMNAFGIFITLLGGFLYSYLNYYHSKTRNEYTVLIQETSKLDVSSLPK